MDRLFDMNDRVAIITGGMGQLGVAYALTLIERGARVVLLDPCKEPRQKKEEVAAALADGSLCHYPVDITRREELVQVNEKIAARWGEPHILINNAGLDSPPDAPESEVGPFEEYPEASYDRVMEVNVKGSLLCCQVFGQAMAKVGRGSIINISSIYGILSPCQDIYNFRRRDGGTFFKPVAYSVSKSAVLNLTRYLATYWAKKNVRVNTLTLAGVFNNQPKEFLAAYNARMPMGRMARIEELLGAIVYLASDASSYMTGANLVVDGGWSAW